MHLYVNPKSQKTFWLVVVQSKGQKALHIKLLPDFKFSQEKVTKGNLIRPRWERCFCRVMDPHWFQCRPGSSILGQYGFGHSSRSGWDFDDQIL